MSPSGRAPGCEADAPQPAESILLAPQKRRDVEVVVLRDRRAGEGAPVWIESAEGARWLRALLWTAGFSRSGNMGPLKRRDRRYRRGNDLRGSRLLIMARDAECGQLF